MYLHVYIKVLSIPCSNICATFCFIFPKSFGRGEELEKSGSIGCMEKSSVLCVCLKRVQEQSLLGWPLSFPFSLSLPISPLAPPLSLVSLWLCSLLWPAFSISGTLRYLWFFSSSSFYLQLLSLSLSTNPCLSFTHSSYKKPVLTTLLSPPLWI